MKSEIHNDAKLSSKQKSRSKSFLKRNIHRDISSNKFGNKMDMKNDKISEQVIYRFNTIKTQIISIAINGDFNTTNSKFQKNTDILCVTSTIEGFKIGHEIINNDKISNNEITWDILAYGDHMLAYFEKISDNYWTIKKTFLDDLQNQELIILQFVGCAPHTLIKVIGRDNETI
jgi:hypothetical protein